MKINYALISRSLIALLFVVAGIQKIMHFSGDVGAVATVRAFGVPFAPLATLIVIIIEVPIALAFAWGYKVRQTGYALIGFTVLATLVVHHNISAPLNAMNALKNLAIIGGLMSAISCFCDDCTVHTKKHKVHAHQGTEGQQG